MITTLVDQSRKDPKIVLKIEFNAYDADHAREVDRIAAKVVDELVEIVQGQYTLPIDKAADPAELTATFDRSDVPAEGPTQAEMDAEDAKLREAVGASIDA